MSDDQPKATTQTEMETRRHFFRFRSTRRLLAESQELEKQEIYFASPEELNDPMEGYKEVFWLGDAILWKNLLRHYILNLVCAAVDLLPQVDETWREPKINAFLTVDSLPTPALQDLAIKATNNFLGDPAVDGVLRQLTSLNLPLGPAGLSTHLLMLHASAITATMTAMAQSGLVANSAISEFTNAQKPHDPPEPSDAGLHSIAPEQLEQLFAAADRRHQEIAFINRYNSRGNARRLRALYLSADFPRRYVAQISQALIHPPWFVACFTDNCTNAAMWGRYGDSHKGVALKFAATPGRGAPPTIQLEGVTATRQAKGHPPEAIWRNTALSFHPVDYALAPPSVDFFRCLGQLPWPKYQNSWLMDGLAGHSRRLRHAFENFEQWQSDLWALFQQSATRKRVDWQFEREYRIVIPDISGTRDAQRRFRYSWSSLTGIVFGLRTTTEDKVRIAEIVERKCRAEGRTSFEFSQVHFSSATHEIEVAPMSLLKFAQPL